MKKTKVLRAKHQTPKLPLMFTFMVWLITDRLKIEGVWFGVIATIIVILWVVSIVNLFCCEPLEPLWKDTPK